MGLNWIPTSKNWYNPKYMGLITVNIIWFLWYNQNFPGVEASKILGTNLFQSLRAAAGGLQDTHGPQISLTVNCLKKSSTTWDKRRIHFNSMCKCVLPTSASKPFPSVWKIKPPYLWWFSWITGDVLKVTPKKTKYSKQKSYQKLKTLASLRFSNWKLFTHTPQKKWVISPSSTCQTSGSLVFGGGIPIGNIHRIRGIKTCFFE